MVEEDVQLPNRGVGREHPLSYLARLTSGTPVPHRPTPGAPQVKTLGLPSPSGHDGRGDTSTSFQQNSAGKNSNT